MTYEELCASIEQTWASLTPEERAEIDARSAAMHARAEVYERALADQVTAIRELQQTEDGGHMLTRIAGVIALEQLRFAALGCGEPRFPPTSWQEALERNRVLTGATIEAIKPVFKKEAVND